MMPSGVLDLRFFRWASRTPAFAGLADFFFFEGLLLGCLSHNDAFHCFGFGILTILLSTIALSDSSVIIKSSFLSCLVELIIVLSILDLVILYPRRRTERGLRFLSRAWLFSIFRRDCWINVCCELCKQWIK